MQLEEISMFWIQRVQDRIQWRALVNALVNFRVLQNAGNLGRKGLCTMELINLVKVWSGN
jgi:hypothetical protein